jgi:nucleoside-diphosphate-sugar epimerase
MKILITGAAGYLGHLLTKNLSQHQRIDVVFALDKKPRPKTLMSCEKIQYLQLDLAKKLQRITGVLKALVC